VLNGVWGARTDHELGELYKTPDPVADIKRRFEKTRKTIRMDQTGATKNII
jgi:hypothetical protein